MPTGLGDEELWLSPTVANNVNPFDDQSGNGNNGSAQGGMGTVADTSEGGSYAYDFDGTNDYINCGSDSSLSFVDGSGDTAMSITGWIKLDSYSNNNNSKGVALLSRGTFTTDSSYSVLLINGKVRLARYAIGSNGSQALNDETDSSQLPLAQWRHVAITYSGCETTGCTEIFIDGSLVSSTSTESSYTGMSGSFKNVEIGVSLRNTSFNRWTNGRQDDIRMFNRVLTQAEITHLATSRGVLGPPGGAANYSPFRNAKYINKTYQIPRFG